YPDSHEVTIDDEPVRLTTHQFQLLHYFATHSGKVLSREQLWHAMPNDDSSDNIDRAIDVHISRLRALIEDNPRQPKRIITVRGVGYQFATDQV
ncbi:winged helix family transcriptional regulator, partial [Salmonella enterica subsp. enterica serovar Thompson]|nr:winged helix family transcriptional regulator [Salmonella enterica subsp. enterica serovar Thompson]